MSAVYYNNKKIGISWYSTVHLYSKTWH